MAKEKIEEVKSTLDKKLKEFEDKFGKGVLVRAGNSSFDRVKEFTSTGSMKLDKATNVGGIPKDGKITHILGHFSSSKTTLSLHIIAEEQKKGNTCAFLDVEGSLDLQYAKNIGVDLDKLFIVDPEQILSKKKSEEIRAVSGEEWIDILIDLIKTNEFGIIVLDSVATLVPKAELESGVQAASIAQLGRLMSKSLRSINAALLPTNTGLILLNQYRTNIGGYGNPYIEASGEALKYYTTLKIELTKHLDKDSNGVYGIDVKAKITKSKVGIPFGEASYYVEFGKGVVKDKEYLDLAIEYGFITKSGSWYILDSENKMQGEDKLLEFLQDNSDYFNDLKIKIHDKIRT